MNKFSPMGISEQLNLADPPVVFPSMDDNDPDVPPERPSHFRPDWGQMFIEADKPSLLIFTTPEREAGHYAEIGRAAGFRILDMVLLNQAVERLSTLVDVDAVMVVCNGGEAGLDILLARLDMMAINANIELSILVGLSGLDQVHAMIDSDRALILCEPSPAEVAVAMTMMIRPPESFERLNDSGRVGEETHIEKLSDDLNRLTRTIEALVQNRIAGEFRPASHSVSGNSLFHSPDRPYHALPSGRASGAAPMDAQRVRAVLRARRLREHILSPELFADPAWDILLDLMAAHLENTRVSVSSLCIAAAVPPTTALRWIRQLTDRGLLERQADPDDGRRIFIALSNEGVAAVHRWFEESGPLLQSAAG